MSLLKPPLGLDESDLNMEVTVLAIQVYYFPTCTFLYIIIIGPHHAPGHHHV